MFVPIPDTGYAYTMKLTSAGLSSRYPLIAATSISILLILHWVGVFVTQDATSGWNSSAALFDLDKEWNVPTFINSFLLLSSGLLSLFLATKAKKSIQQLGWVVSTLFFIYLAMDELFIIHEQLAEPIRKVLNIGNSNPLYHAWVIPALAAIILLVGIIMFIHAFYVHLKIFNRLLVRIVILASGVVFLEILGTLVYDKPLIYRLLMVSAEEIFELSMAAAILYYLLNQVKISPGR